MPEYYKSVNVNKWNQEFLRKYPEKAKEQNRNIMYAKLRGKNVNYKPESIANRKKTKENSKGYTSLFKYTNNSEKPSFLKRVTSRNMNKGGRRTRRTRRT